jgi:hypothetical protein
LEEKKKAEKKLSEPTGSPKSDSMDSKPGLKKDVKKKGKVSLVFSVGKENEKTLSPMSGSTGRGWL